MTEAVRVLLRSIGEDPGRDGLLATPGRVSRALREMTGGMHEDPRAILSRTFECDSDEMVVVTGIRFASLCEHHLLPFTGTACVGYIPQNKKVVGLSKIPRLVECFARRLQLQERMGGQIADAMVEFLAPKGVGVLLVAAHACMACRGVRQSDARMVTNALRGAIREDAAARAEFMGLARLAG